MRSACKHEPILVTLDKTMLGNQSRCEDVFTFTSNQKSEFVYCTQIGRREIAWPPQAPGLASIHFLYWGYLKAPVYNDEIENLNQIKNRTIEVCGTIAADTLNSYTKDGYLSVGADLNYLKRSIAKGYYNKDIGGDGYRDENVLRMLSEALEWCSQNTWENCVGCANDLIKNWYEGDRHLANIEIDPIILNQKKSSTSHKLLHSD
ncbi:hypothetical protein Trydic_g20511 [Trypoxylus dichotomus]